MEAQVWTLIALFGATVVGSFFYLGQRIDGLGVRMDTLSARVEDQGRELAARMEDQGRHMEDQGRRIEDLGRLLADRIYEVGTKLDEHLRRHAS